MSEIIKSTKIEPRNQTLQIRLEGTDDEIKKMEMEIYKIAKRMAPEAGFDVRHE